MFGYDAVYRHTFGGLANWPTRKGGKGAMEGRGVTEGPICSGSNIWDEIIVETYTCLFK